MSVGDYGWLEELEPGEGDAAGLCRLAERLLDKGDREGAAIAYDRAYGLTPDDRTLIAARARVLDSLAVVEHGLRFRYVPAGCRAIGSNTGDPDEKPVHLVRLRSFWLAEVPVSWAAYCALMRWRRPPEGHPDRERVGPRDRAGGFMLSEANKIRLQYCEDATTRAIDWHSHGGLPLFGIPPRTDSRRPERYDRKPMVAVSWQEAEELAERLSVAPVGYRLPTEAEWETAARGGLVAARYPWGDQAPTSRTCDYNRFDDFSVLPSRTFAPNDYGLYAMSGGVWEWTADWYDAQYYQESPRDNPAGPASGVQKVLRGGSWSDCAEVVTVSFRKSRDATPWWEDERGWGKQMTPNIGFRLCRTRRD